MASWNKADNTDGFCWHFPFLAFCQGAAIFLYVSWLTGPVRVLWDRVDRVVFFALNGSLEGGGPWAFFWAICNNRLFDFLPAFIMIGIYLHFMLAENRAHLRKRLAMAIFIVFYSFIILELLKETVCEIDRLSPTMVLEGVILLSELFPELSLKDASSVSFPGDHAAVLLLFASFMWCYGGVKYGVVATATALIFSLPRLVDGGHWLTDDLVGGGFIALTAIAWVFGPPLQANVVAWLEKRLYFIGRQYRLKV